jgi:hypothetical protein
VAKAANECVESRYLKKINRWIPVDNENIALQSAEQILIKHQNFSRKKQYY